MRALAAILVIFLCGGVGAAEKVLGIGYLELENDPRYSEQHADARFQGQPWGRPYEGAGIAVKESRFAGAAAGVTFDLKRESMRDAESMFRAVERLAGQGVRFFLLDAPGDVVAEVARRTKGHELLLFNLTSLDDELRQAQCHAHLLHVAPSRAMLMDALAQYLVARKWREALVLKGPRPQDEALHRSFERAAKRFGLKIVDTRSFVLSRDPRQRSRSNVALLTGGADYDVVVVLDSDGEFARDVPYQIQKPRPVVGSAGLVPDWWHWAWERHGAPQLNGRFLKATKRPMTGFDWSAWMGVKAIAEAVVRTNSAAFATLKDYIRGEAIVLDGFKGNRINFRPWDNQLRQPILLTTGNWVAGRAPVDGFLHARNNLDTLGFDEKDSRCRF
jgi:ABC transporter substrate binding protein (PQQ-dependent alcohol dehydrogenase system)